MYHMIQNHFAGYWLVDGIDPEKYRQEFINLASRGARVLAHPHRWYPESVENPETGFPFSPASAWELIVACLERGDQIEVIEMKKPPGTRGFVMYIQLQTDRSLLYVKLQLGAGKIIGRSFHYSNFTFS